MKNTIIYDLATKKFTEIKPLPVVKPPPVELTPEEKSRLIAEFEEIFKREPGQEETLELFSEELKLKGGKSNGEA